MTRTAVVTGGATGIGRAAAAQLVREGAEVTIVGRRRDVLAAAATEIGAKAVAFDAADPASVTAALPQLPEAVDVLVNAAGGNTDLGAERSTDELVDTRSSWLANFEANVLTAVLVTTALLPRIADGGRIVNLGSVTARSGGGSYGAVKAALEPWTSELAFRLGRTRSPLRPRWARRTRAAARGRPSPRNRRSGPPTASCGPGRARTAHGRRSLRPGHRSRRRGSRVLAGTVRRTTRVFRAVTATSRTTPLSRRPEPPGPPGPRCPAGAPRRPSPRRRRRGSTRTPRS